MTAIPPDILGAAAQSGIVAREAARPRDADRTAQANGAAQQVRALTDAADQVGTTDGDTAVFTDAEGAGSQGRAFGDADAAEEPVDLTDQPPGDAPGLDIQA
jgi:hypothetical protein